MKKTVKYVILGLVIGLVLTAGVFGLVHWQQEARFQGKLVFADSYDAGKKVDRIVITNQKNKIEIVQDKGYWKLKDFHNYYADFNMIKGFFDTLNSSAYLQPVKKELDLSKYGLQNPLTDKNATGTLIQIYADGELMDSVIVGTKDRENGYFLARRSNSDKVWLVGGNYELPWESIQWLPTPILDIPESAVEMLGIDGHLIARQMAMEDFRDRLGMKVNVNWLMGILSSLDVTDVMPQDLFVETYGDVELSKIYDIATFYGLRFELDFYQTSDNSLWLNVKLLTDAIALTAINDYINDNKFLYDGWYFKISPLQKDFLMNYRLM